MNSFGSITPALAALGMTAICVCVRWLVFHLLGAEVSLVDDQFTTFTLILTGISAYGSAIIRNQKKIFERLNPEQK